MWKLVIIHLLFIVGTCWCGCTDDNDCLVCGPQDLCTQCVDGFFVNENGTCSDCWAVQAGCLECDLTGYCSLCAVSYQLTTFATCELVPFNETIPKVTTQTASIFGDPHVYIRDTVDNDHFCYNIKLQNGSTIDIVTKLIIEGDVLNITGNLVSCGAGQSCITRIDIQYGSRLLSFTLNDIQDDSNTYSYNDFIPDVAGSFMYVRSTNNKYHRHVFVGDRANKYSFSFTIHTFIHSFKYLGILFHDDSAANVNTVSGAVGEFLHTDFTLANQTSGHLTLVGGDIVTPVSVAIRKRMNPASGIFDDCYTYEGPTDFYTQFFG